MKTLFPAQEANRDAIIRALSQHGGAIDSSMTGTGKTVVASHVAAKGYKNVGVICPKIVIPHWEDELKDAGVTPLFVSNYEKIRTGKSPFLTKRGKKIFTWHLPKDTLLIWDEVHKSKGPFTQNAQMLVAATTQGLHNLMVSATACEDPTEMRAIGYALGLHNLNQSANGMRSWVGWMKEHGCWKDQWHKWNRGGLAHLKRLNKTIYEGGLGVALRLGDLPGAFSENHVYVERAEYAAQRDIVKAYKGLNISDEVLERLVGVQEEKSFHDKVRADKATEEERAELGINVLTEILRARQLTEALKVPDLIDQAHQAIKEDWSVIVFVNFRDTAEALWNALPDPGIIIGGQAADDRQGHITRFQTNKNRAIVVMTSAGGVGVSLHDTDGRFPRQAILSPTFNLKEHIQALGRAHRAGSKSPVVQRIMVAANTIEEKVVDLLEQKRLALDTLHARPETVGDEGKAVI